MFWAEIWKISEFIFIWKFSGFGGEIFHIFEWASFRNDISLWSKMDLLKFKDNDKYGKQIVQGKYGRVV